MFRNSNLIRNIQGVIKKNNSILYYLNVLKEENIYSIYNDVK